MSHQNNNDENQTEVIEQNDNQLAVVGALAPNGEPQPAVFKLDTDCWDEVFDCLSLEDVHSFGQTCKAFQRVTGEYFQWKYEAVCAKCQGDYIYIDNKQMNRFSELVPKIWFHGDTNDSMLRYVESSFKAVKQMRFSELDFGGLDFKLIENILRKLEVVEIYFCKFDRVNFGALVESCVNLKRVAFAGVPPFTWPVHQHPTLQHLGFYNNNALGNGDELKIFLEHSPNIRSIQMVSSLLWAKRDSLLNANVELDELAIIILNTSDTAAVIGLLNDLHQRGFYKRLHLRTYTVPSPDQLLALHGLITLYIPYEKIIGYPVLANIKELGIVVPRNAPPIDDMNAWVSYFINIEHLAIVRPNFNDILLFIGRSMKLRSIEIWHFQGNVLDVSALKKERKKLEGARKVTIYVDEDVYLATKWASSQTTFDLIEIKRKLSHNIIRPHSFYRYFH